MALPNEIEVPQAGIFDQETKKYKKKRKNDQAGTQAKFLVRNNLFLGELLATAEDLHPPFPCFI